MKKKKERKKKKLKKKTKKPKSMPSVVSRRDRLRLTSGIICGLGSFAVWGSFVVGDHLRRCTVLMYCMRQLQFFFCSFFFLRQYDSTIISFCARIEYFPSMMQKRGLDWTLQYVGQNVESNSLEYPMEYLYGVPLKIVLCSN